MYAEGPATGARRPVTIARLWRALRPAEGWSVLLLTWAAVISLPAAALKGGVIAGLAPTLWLATLGLLLTWWLSHRRIRGWHAAGLLALAGLGADLLWGVPVIRIERLAGQIGRWLVWLIGERSLPAPPLTYFREQASALGSYGQRVGWWLDGLWNGQGAPDNLVTIGLAGMLAWGVAAWAAWQMVRRGQPFVALLPTGAMLVLQVYWAEASRWTLLLFLGAASLLLILGRLAWLTASWERHGVDYSPEIFLDALMAGAGITIIVVLLAPTLPFLTSAQASQAFWRVFESPYRKIEEQLGRSFASAQPARSLVPPAGIAPGGMPRSHLLGGRPELGREVAFRAQVRGARMDEALYWRGQTFSYYTGHGWDEAEGATTQHHFAAGEAWEPSRTGAEGRPLVSTIEIIAGSRAVLYAPGEPVAADRPYLARLRAPDDLVALAAGGGPVRYTILSEARGQDADHLQRTGEIYPSDVISHHLQLPADLDPRLAALVAEWTTGATNPFDRARAIEAALRRLDYTLDVPAPPVDREVVSWFLFDLQRGYCDYFASAMVVLARVSGIPARLAIGYASASYDPQTDRRILTELDAHSWAELYFPGAGWVVFEPTPAQPAPERASAAPNEVRPPPQGAIGPSDLDAAMAELRTLGAVSARIEQEQKILRAILAGAHAVLIGWAGGCFLWLRRRGKLPWVGGKLGASYERLLRWGARLGRPARASETPREYAIGLAKTAAVRAGRARWGHPQALAAADIIAADARDLTCSYEAALFGESEVKSVEELHTPRRLWRAFRQLWLQR